MVIRPAVERWNRGQLEDEYHKLYRQNVEVKKKNNELEKTIKQLNGRLRRTIGDGHGGVVDSSQNEEILELQRENHLLSQKLKALKHQLLVYTRPGVRAPMINSLTSRTSARPSVRQIPLSVRPASVQSGLRKTPTEPLAPREKSQSPIKLKLGSKKIEDDSKPAKPKTPAEKSLVIKLNRELKARMTEITELTFKVRSAQEKFQSLREEYDSCIGELEVLRHRLSLHEDSAGSGSEREFRIRGDRSILEKELAMVRDENRLLRDTNDRLVASALDGDGLRGGSEEEVKTLQMRIHEMETQLMDADNERKSLCSQTKDLEKEKQKLTKKVAKLRQQMDVIRSEKISFGQNQMSDRADDITDRDLSPVPSKKTNLTDVMGPLEKLFDDVTFMLETRTSISDVSSEGKSEFSSTRYQKMYQELYEELEKVRNMLLIQHKINQQQSEEIILLNSTSEGYKREYERKLSYLIKELKKRKQRIVFLEDQLKSIAYGTDLRRLEIDSIADVSLTEERPNEIELHFSKLTVNCKDSSVFSSLRPQLFISTEFFDFELQTTDAFVGPEVILDYSTLYDIVVSNLFLHYVETDGITVELYEARGDTYHLCGSGIINLRHLISLKPETMLNSELSLISADKQREVAKLAYSLSIKEELLKALKAHKKQSVARSLMVEQDTISLGESNELVVSVHRCSNLNLLTKDKKPPSSFLVYELFDFDPVRSKTVPNNSNPEYSVSNTFKVPLSDAIHNYLNAVNLSISFVETDSTNRLTPTTTKPDVLGRLSIPLFLLARNKPIVGTFSLTDSTGSISKATADISIRWRFDYKIRKNEALPEIPPASPSSASEMSENEIKEFERALAEESRKVRITVESDTSSDEDDFDEKLPVQMANDKRVKQISSQSIESEESSSSTVISAALARKESNPQNLSSLTDDEDFIPNVQPAAHLGEPSTELSQQKLDTQDELEVISATSSNRADLDNIPTEQGASEVGEVENELTDNIESIPEEDTTMKIVAPPRTLIGNLPSLANITPIPLPRLRRGVEFTDPLHRSIPPSESSSFSETEEPRRMRVTTSNPPSHHPSGVLKLTERVDENASGDEENVEAVVAVRIGRLALVERSLLVDHRYDRLNVFVEWKFLDFPQDECETPNSLPLPRNRSFSSNFDYSKEYGLNKRRISLLRQWIELLNRLEFTLVTDGGDDRECDDLGVAQLDLREVAAQNLHRIEFLNIDGMPIAEIEVEITYSKILLEYFNV